MKKNNFSFFISTVLLPSFLIYCLIFYDEKNGILEGVDDITFDTKIVQNEDNIDLNIDNKDVISAEKGTRKTVDNQVIEQKPEEISEDHSTNEIVIPNNNQEPLIDSKTNDNDDKKNVVSKIPSIQKTENSSNNNNPSNDNNSNDNIDNNNNSNSNNSEPKEIIYNNDGLSYEVLNIINSTRANNGLNQLIMDNTLIQIAKIRAEEISTKWSHTRPNGNEWWTIFSEFKIRGVFGENLAYGQSTATEVVNDWMQSNTHRANILSSSFNKIGIAVYNCDGTNYWVQEFSS